MLIVKWTSHGYNNITHNLGHNKDIIEAARSQWMEVVQDCSS